MISIIVQYIFAVPVEVSSAQVQERRVCVCRVQYVLCAQPQDVGAQLGTQMQDVCAQVQNEYA